MKKSLTSEVVKKSVVKEVKPYDKWYPTPIPCIPSLIVTTQHLYIIAAVLVRICNPHA